jgi:hypothetical protein
MNNNMNDNYETIIQLILKQKQEEQEEQSNGSNNTTNTTNHSVQEESIDDPEYKKLLEQEKIREQNPVYLAEKERVLMKKMVEDDSPFNHPCQNPSNTVTLLSNNKCHEIDIELDKSNSTALLNIINIDSSKRESFINLLYSVTTFLNTESIKKIYQNVMLSDWDMRLKKIEKNRFVKKVKSNIDRSVCYEFVIMETNTSDIVETISTAMGMSIDSHLDQI